MRYQDLGPDYYERQAAIRRKIAYHVREIEALGLEVTLCRIPDPEPDPAGQWGPGAQALGFATGQGGQAAKYRAKLAN